MVILTQLETDEYFVLPLHPWNFIFNFLVSFHYNNWKGESTHGSFVDNHFDKYCCNYHLWHRNMTWTFHKHVASIWEESCTSSMDIQCNIKELMHDKDQHSPELNSKFLYIYKNHRLTQYRTEWTPEWLL